MNATALRRPAPDSPPHDPVDAAAEREPVSRVAGAEGASILIVDDEPRNLFALEEVLTGLGRRIVQARSGEEALLHLLSEEFAVILLDVQMPGLDGYAVADLVRARDKTRHVPIIFLTAVNKDEAQIFRGYASGAVDYMFKPTDPVILRSKVAVFIDLFEKTEEVKRKAELEKQLLQENFRIRAEKLRADHALRRREQQQTLIIGTLPLALYVEPLAPASGQRRFITDNIERISGFPAERFTSSPHFWRERIDPADRARVLSGLASAAESGSAMLEYRWICADGKERYFLDHAALVRDEAGQPVEIVGTWLDITDRKQLEHQLLHAQKMEAIGQLTGGIAHDFNNMLSIVIGNIELLRPHIVGETGLRRCKLALEGALRCANMTQRLLTFARRQPLRSTQIELNEFVASTIDLLRRMVAETIAIEFAPTPGLWPLRSDPAQIEAALVNLAVNARDAMPDGGTLTITLANVAWSEFSHVDAEVEPGDYVMLSVGDTGTGMAPEVLEHVFEPFFTTKEIGKGTGLGLSTTYGFVKQAGGHVAIESEVGRGTTVRLWLPRGAPLAEEERKDAAPATEARGETILVVEDEGAVREIAVLALKRLGYSVLEAATAEGGLGVLKGGAEIDLLFTDLKMPGSMGGRELAREARQMRPGLKVLFASGYNDGEDDASDLAPCLGKPYLGEMLAERVRAVLDSGQPVA